ncbi:peptidase C12, ubiquitin carboxyl-terminal hydrolase 1 [Anaeromyces robustus]|uniref:Ubiquitin carboxyl-terminal hydrolase n=1 Tax=Anaeromyces robustus TaxID=1754192 RepID=A0A1Y1WVV3_9FUNG|nr:peptidase C12, ubiquitin carboxyl-terminal hydrolase 1 [Anaeromyces robustus]|eukprot:ORX77326.1 peptidase C12, ubiquitin carboxyl-terminal hydrolase 1 [Anaeromyces robustus]
MSYSETKSIWHPLESNPEVMNEYIHKLGVTGNWGFSDLWGLDDEALMFVSQPCLAVLLLFPITEESENLTKNENERIKKEGQTVSKDIYFSNQTIPNACGTMAILHALLNNTELVDIGDGILKKIYQDTKELSPMDKAKYLEQSKDLANVHSEYSIKGQTTVTEADDNVDLHFICFIQKNGDLYELDGRKEFPINHGKCDDLLKGAVNIIKDVISRNPNTNEITAQVFVPLD